MRAQIKQMAESISTESDLNRAVAKVARVRQLSAGEIAALVHEVNHAANRHKLGAGEHKAHAFDLADLGAVHALLGTRKSAHAVDHIKVAEKYMVREKRVPHSLARTVHNALIRSQFDDFLKTAEKFIKSADQINAEITEALSKLGHDFYCSGLNIEGLRVIMNAVKEAESDEVFDNDWDPIIKALEKEYPIKTGRPPVISDHNWVKVHMSRIGHGLTDFASNHEAPYESIIAIRTSIDRVADWPKSAQAIIHDSHARIGPASRNLILDFLQKYVKQVASPIDINSRLMSGGI